MAAAAQNPLETVVEQRQPQSLLDRIVERQAETASRYMPVMDTATAIKRIAAISELKGRVLVEGIDYGKIPGTDKPTLLKPGAEKICAFFGYVPSYEILPGSIEDWNGDRFGEPLFYYHVACTLKKDGTPVGQGTGSCSSWEKKYRYRNASRKCPNCGKETIITGKAEYGGGFLCFAKKGGCGAKFLDGDAKIVGQEVGQVANPDFADVINTVQKMADKRAYIAATLAATGASQWFTQDVEDMPQFAGDIPDTGGHPVGTQAAANHVAQQKIEKAKAAPAQQAEPRDQAVSAAELLDKKFVTSKDRFERLAMFGDLKNRLIAAAGDRGEIRYYEVLQRHGVEKSDQFTTAKTAIAAFREMLTATIAAEKQKQLADAEPPAPTNPEVTNDDVPF